MPTIEQQLSDVCDFLHRFLSGQRGFTTSDVRAGISRLRELEAQLPAEVGRTAYQALVREVSGKLDSSGDNPLPRSGVRS